MYPFELYDTNPDHYSNTSSDFTPTATPEPEERNDRLDKHCTLDAVKKLSRGFYVNAKVKYKNRLFLDDVPIRKPKVKTKAPRGPIRPKPVKIPRERPYQCTRYVE